MLTDQNEMSPLDRGPSIECFLPSFGSFGQEVSEDKIFLEIDQSETRVDCAAAMFVNGSKRNEHFL